jgi:GNAT superfamily N-acetyltransferase
MFRFRPLRRDDFPTLARWFSAPHARRWYGEGPAEIQVQYGPIVAENVPVRAFVVEHEGRDIGLVEWVRLGDHPDVQQAYAVVDPEMANCDIVIGEPDAAHHGLGAPLIRAFLQEIVFADPRVPGCVIDPETENFIAIRSYEKAGFRFARAMPDDAEGNSVHLLELMRDELQNPGPAPSTWIRPARSNELSVVVDIDDDACTAYSDIGLRVSFGDDHPLSVSERRRWQQALDEGRLLVACAGAGEPVGFAAFGLVDGRPFLHQISVRRAHARRGVGRALLERVYAWSVRPGELWLTTYRHVPWNGPWYEREGFREVSPDVAGPELQAILEAERGLPDPDEHVLMVRKRP